MFILVYFHIYTMYFPCKRKCKRTFSVCIHTTLSESRPMYPLPSHRRNISLHNKPVFKCMLHDGQRRGLLWRRKESTIIRSGQASLLGNELSLPFFFFSARHAEKMQRWLEYKMRIYDKREDDVLIRLKDLKITIFFSFFCTGNKTLKGGAGHVLS